MPIRTTKEQMTYQQSGYKPVAVVWPDGRPVLAGDLCEGQAFRIDPETGVIELVATPA